MTTKKLVRLAVLTAFGVLLMIFIAFPLPFFPEFMTYDPGDIPGLIAAFAFGPWAGLPRTVYEMFTWLFNWSF